MEKNEEIIDSGIKVFNNLNIQNVFVFPIVLLVKGGS